MEGKEMAKKNPNARTIYVKDVVSWELAGRIAEQRGTTRSSVIETLLSQWIEENEEIDLLNDKDLDKFFSRML
jgi:hypothetical protein